MIDKGIVNASIESASKSFHIYIGPAELCPCPPLDEPFLIICGEQNQASKKLIEKKAKTNKRKDNSFEIKNNVIGKSGAEKNWYTFNEPTLNGIFSEKQIDWCNQSIKITTEAITLIKAEKLQTIIEQSKLPTNNKISDLKLTIAQGDP